MLDPDEERIRTAELRRLAMLRLEAEPIEIPDLSMEEVHQAIDQLRMHKIMLEMQMEELRRAQDELVASHDRYSDLYDFAPVGYVTVGSDGLIVEANLTLAGMLEVDRQALVQMPLNAFIVPEDQDIYRRHRHKALESQEHVTCRLRMIRASAEPLWVGMDSTLIEHTEEGGQLRTIISDITERIVAEDERRQLETKVWQAQKLESLGILAGGVAHDFNNILTVLLGNADLAMGTLPPQSRARPLLQNIQRAGQRAAELTAQMLAYSGQGKFVVAQVDVNELVRDMASLLESSIAKKITLRYELAPDLPAVKGDATQLRQIFLNLITNASEAIGDNVGLIRVTTSMGFCDRAFLEAASPDRELAVGRYLTIAVSDTGPGMTEETKARIFEPFFTTKFTGRGLGLAAVRGIASGHNGTIVVDSKLGQGTTFTLLLPAPDDLVMTTPSVAPKVEEAVEESDWSGTGTILLVEDEETLRAVTVHMLQSVGYSVLAASDGVEAVDLFRQRHGEISCVLLDLKMPRMDGEEAFEELRRIRADVPVILSSGYGENASVERLSSKGLAGFIQKPYRFGNLMKKLQDALTDRVAPPTS